MTDPLDIVRLFSGGAPSAPEPECMKAREVATYLGVNRKTVYEYAARKVIPCQRLGRRFVFSRPALAAWLARQAVPPASAPRA
jgi:excisionase family DNA binding protein